MHQSNPYRLTFIGLLLGATACGGSSGPKATFVLTLRPVPPPSQADLFEDIELLVVRVTDSAGESVEYELEVERGTSPAIEDLGPLPEGAIIELEGYGGTGEASPLVARGRSGAVDVGRAETGSVDIFMAAVGEVATFHELTAGAWGAAVASDGDGRFFVLGGAPDGWDDDGADAISSWDIVPPAADFEPVTVGGFPTTADAWAGYTNEITGRVHHSATLLAEGSHSDVGKILVAGGWGSLQASRTVTAQIFLYDPHAEPEQAIEVLDGLKTGRAQHLAVALPSGNVVFFGGYSHTDQSNTIDCPETVEVYDAEQRTSDYGSQMTDHCMVDGAAAAIGADALHCGGVEWASNDTHEAHGDCIKVDRFGNVTPVDGPSALGGAGLLLPAMASMEGDRALLTGGVEIAGEVADSTWFDASDRAFLYDSGSWTEVARMNIPRAGHVASALPSGDVLVAGGAAGISNRGFDIEDELPCAEVYHPGDNAWTLLDSTCQAGSDVGSLPTGLFRPSIATDPYWGALIWSGIERSMSGQPKAQPSYGLYLPELD